ncbi:MAG: GerAB/ArcD/ProY family transporter [Clostridiales bacterium]|nr:GerAB/ArcD/ProY family transporter [Clostridiales bacterium]
MDRKEISISQFFKLLVCLSFSPAVRVTPLYETIFADQAGWLAPLISFVPIFILLKMFDDIFSKYTEESYGQVVQDILGGILGKIVLIIYLIGIAILLASYIRYYAIKINLALFPNSRIHIPVIIMLLLTYLSLRRGLVVISRMGEILFVLIVMSFVVFVVLSINNIKPEHLLPISYKDIIPMGQASYGIAGLWGYLTFVCFFSDRIKDKNEMDKRGLKYLITFTISILVLGIVTIGGLGHSVVKRTSLPFFVAVKNISLFNIIERVEAIAITVWVAADFMLIAVFLQIIIKLLEDIFDIEDTEYLIGILIMFFYGFTFYITSTMFELQEFSVTMGMHMIVILGIAIPYIIYILGKIRKKI